MEKAPLPPGAEKSDSRKQVVKQIIGVAIAGVFLYFAFRDIEFDKALNYVKELDPLFLAGVFVSGILSHLLRAVRWVILLAPLSDKKISLWNSFCAIMYGYAINIVIPRGGEVARLVSISKWENIPWAGVLPTMFIDRLLDIAMLVMLIGITLNVLPAGELNADWLGKASAIGTLMCVATVAGLVALPFGGKIIRAIAGLAIFQSKIPEKIMTKVVELSEQFDQGTRSLTNWVSLPVIAALSFGIWALYWLNLYWMGMAFHLGGKLDVAKSIVIFTIGSVGVLVPTPGSVGGYHYLIRTSMESLIHVDSNLAGAFAFMLHLMGFVIITGAASLVCFAIQSNRRVR